MKARNKKTIAEHDTERPAKEPKGCAPGEPLADIPTSLDFCHHPSYKKEVE